VSRLPIRLRLALVFTGVMAVLLVGAGLFLRIDLARGLDGAIDQGLRARAADVAALVAQGGEGPAEPRSPLTERGEHFAQVLDARGRILDATPLVRARPLLGPAEVRAALRRPLTLERQAGRGAEAPLRLRAVPASADGHRFVVVVATSLEQRREAVDRLTTLLLVGGPLTLLFVSLAGYGVARAALRPVDSMRRRAARISGAESGVRLPLPTAHDEIRGLGETLNEMLARIDAAMARERSFVADASHELRTPLTIIRGELELAGREGRSPEALRAAVASAGEEAERLTRLADDLLVVARADQGRLPVHPEAIAVWSLLVAARARTGEAAGRVVVEVDGDLALRADRLRLEQALGNLVDNALRHGAGPVTLRATASGGWVRLEVRDAGGGFPPEFLPVAFERFARADRARTVAGAGLGLAIVRAIALAHGGEAGARNLSGGGAAVWLRLPGGVGEPRSVRDLEPHAAAGAP
jgi:signal transduction histidine kinase